MRSIVFTGRRLAISLMLVVALASASIVGLLILRRDLLPALNMRKMHAIVVTRPKILDVTITERFVCQIHARRLIEVRASAMGYLEAIQVKEGQQVREGDVLFKIMPILFQNKAAAELNSATVRAPFDGIIDRLYRQQGSLIEEGDILTALADNRVMWVYFNVPERAYLEFTASSKQDRDPQKIELELANDDRFAQPCMNITVAGQFNKQTGDIAFRADFPNPQGVLRHGQTGTILSHRPLKDALVIPKRATFELLDKRYVWAIGEDDVAHQRLITITHELEDLFVIKSGLDVEDKIVLEGTQHVKEGKKVNANLAALTLSDPYQGPYHVYYPDTPLWTEPAPAPPVVPAPEYNRVPDPTTFVFTPPTNTDRCLITVDVPADSRFVVNAPKIDPAMIVAPRVTGLPFGSLRSP